MAHDFSKEPQARNPDAVSPRKKIPAFILIIVGIFLASLIFYMIADRKPKQGEVPADTSIPATSEHDSSNTTATAVEETTGQGSNTATASDH